MKRHLLTTVLWTLLYSGAVKPCDCKPLASVTDELEESELVVSGKVINVTRKALSQTTAIVDSLGREFEVLLNPKIVNEYLIRLDRTYKGISKSDTLILRTGIDPVTDCGLILDLGRVYIFYCYYDISFMDRRDLALTYTTSICTRTRLFDKKEEKEILQTGSR